jgi:hypothetical protein
MLAQNNSDTTVAMMLIAVVGQNNHQFWLPMVTPVISVKMCPRIFVNRKIAILLCC